MQPCRNIKLFHAASIVAWVVAATVLSPAVAPGQVAGMTLDQAQEIGNYHYDDYRSGWQSFTAGTNGHLGAVDLQLYSTAGSNWTATLAIYRRARHNRDPAQLADDRGQWRTPMEHVCPGNAGTPDQRERLHGVFR